MVTVWPIQSEDVANQIRSALEAEDAAALRSDLASRDAATDRVCAAAARGYRRDLDVSGARIDTGGERLTSAGPYLIAWAPGGDKGKPGQTALLADLGSVQTYGEAKRAFEAWRYAIEGRRSDWGTSEETGFRDVLRDWANRAGPILLDLVSLS